MLGVRRVKMKKKFFDGFTPKDDVYLSSSSIQETYIYIYIERERERESERATMFRVLKHVRYGGIFHELFTNSHRNSLN